jgi:hypothetical protein
MRKQAVKCGTSAKKRKEDRQGVDMQRVGKCSLCLVPSGIPVDWSILQEKSFKIAATMGIEDFSASNGWISCFKQCHCLVFKKLAGESAAVYTNTTDLWFERLPKLVEGYEAQDIYNADEIGLFFNCLPDRMLALKGETCQGGKRAME